MATTSTPIFAQAPYAAIANLSAVTACTTRGPTATANLAAANIIVLVPTTTNGVRIDQITIKASSTAFTSATVAQTVTLWYWDGTTAFPIDEFLVTAVTPSTTVASFKLVTAMSNLSVNASHALYVSTSITTTASTTALTVIAIGGSY